MKRFFLFILIVIMSIENGKACDACGCSIGTNGVGLLSNYRYNTIGFRWFHTPFHSTESGFGNSKDNFQTLELFARYQITQRWKATLQQPFKWNHRQEGDGTERSLSGIADTRLTINYALLDNKKFGENWQLYFELGRGIKIPTGDYQGTLHDGDLPDNFNLGTGNWSALFQSNLILTKKKTGVSLNFNYQKNGESTDGYQFGNQTTFSTLFFTQIKKKPKWKWTPFAGINLEKINQDFHSNGNSAHSTGGKGAFVMGGLNVQFDSWQIGVSSAIPFTQTYSEGEVEAKPRTSLELNFIF